MSAYFLSLNRNKKSHTLDLKSTEGKKIFFELVKKADVLVNNFHGTMEKLGVDYETLKSILPHTGKLKDVVNPIEMSGVDDPVYNPPPLLSEHSEAILSSM